MKIATFFGGAVNDTTTKEYSDSVRIGEILAEQGYLVRNGGYHGLMEAVSKGAASKNGLVIGFTCKSFGSTRGNAYLSSNIPCEDIFDRLRNLFRDSKVFIIQKGGVGTLTELFLCLDLIRKQKANSPKIILIGEFWKNILNALSALVPPHEIQLLQICTNIEDLNELI